MMAYRLKRGEGFFSAVSFAASAHDTLGFSPGETVSFGDTGFPACNPKENLLGNGVVRGIMELQNIIEEI